MKAKLLLLALPVLMLASCTNIKAEKDTLSDEEINNMIEEAMEETPIEILPYEGDASPLELLDTIEQETSESLVKFNKGDSDQYISVVDTDYHLANAPMTSYGSYTPGESDVVLVDENDNQINLEAISQSQGKVTYKVPVSKFEENHGYHIQLKNDLVKFSNKDKSIRQMTYYSLDVNELNRQHTVVRTNETIKSFDINNVEYFDVDAYGAYFIYNEVFDINPSVTDETGMKFRISDPDDEKDNQETVYGKLISNQKNPNGGGYIIRYEPCKGNDLYENLSINDSIVIDQNNADIKLADGIDGNFGETLGRAFATHPDTITTMRGLAESFGVVDNNLKASVLDWASMIQISFTLKWDDSTSTFTWGATATLTINPEDNITVTLRLSYKQTIRFTVTASLSLEYWLFVPTGINYKLEVKEDDTKEVEFGVQISTNLSPYDEEKIKESIENDILDAFKNDVDVKSKFKGDGGTATSDGRSYPLIRVDCYYFWPADIRFEIDFYWKCQLTLEMTVKYTSHSQRVDISMSNSKGCDPHSESKAVNDKSITFNFMGTFHAEVGLKMSLGIGISGFYKFFHAEIYIAAYGAVDASGFLVVGITWSDSDPVSVTGNVGGKFEVSIGVKWGVDIYLLFGGFKFEWPIAKLVLLGFSNESAINSFISNEATLEITDQDYSESGHWIDLDDYHFLGVTCFDSKNFSGTTMDMKHDDSYTVSYGAFLDENKQYYFNYELTKGSEYVEFKDYKLRILDVVGITEFDAEIKITVNPKLACADKEDVTKVIKVHFTNNLKQEIKVQDYDGNVSSVGTYVVGITCKLPVPQAPRYMKFVGWRNTRTTEVLNYDPNDPNCGSYTPSMADVQSGTTSVTFEYLFEDDYTWLVTWMDGLGNIVKTEQVQFDHSATPPEASVRDQYMVSPVPGYEYVFTGYDTDYSKITQNTVIHAQYELRKVGA